MRLNTFDQLPENQNERADREVAELVDLARTSRYIRAEEVIYQTARNRAARAAKALAVDNITIQTVKRDGGIWYVINRR